MITMENASELDYYDEIITYYKDSTKNEEEKEIVEKWSDRSYISIMNDLNENKQLKDADISDVVKNSIILILNLFDKKCQVTSDTKLSDLPEEDKLLIKEALLNALE